MHLLVWDVFNIIVHVPDQSESEDPYACICGVFNMIVHLLVYLFRSLRCTQVYLTRSRFFFGGGDPWHHPQAAGRPFHLQPVRKPFGHEVMS